MYRRPASVVLTSNLHPRSEEQVESFSMYARWRANLAFLPGRFVDAPIAKSGLGDGSAVGKGEGMEGVGYRVSWRFEDILEVKKRVAMGKESVVHARCSGVIGAIDLDTLLRNNADRYCIPGYESRGC